ncbi:neutral/alkaline ceramidase [Pendulispora brunnea]|uniref:Neutral ceramidase n=1 Tax=Pendulispora brunnea TaxID=2905690 RepID=A0ABZ2KE69_9BACT
MMMRNPIRGRSLVLAALMVAPASLAFGCSVDASSPADGKSENAATLDEPYLVGRGIADITGEAAEGHGANYGRLDQTTVGIHIRQRARAFIVVDRTTGKRVVLVTADEGSMYASVRQAVLAKLNAKYGSLYNERNILIAVTHTHGTPGGYSDYNLYNIVTFGFHQQTFDAFVDGVVESIDRAHADLAPGTISLGRSQLSDASANRSRQAFDLDPAADKSQFPNAIDTTSVVLRFDRGGSSVGALNWFPTHGTSMTGDNGLITGDNKGYAALHWEREINGVNYRNPGPSFVAAFAQTNAGDMSPNLDLKPGTGPTNDQFANTRIIGTRQYQAARAAFDQPAEAIAGSVDYRLSYVEMEKLTVRPEFTGDGQSHTTCGATLGASFAAGSTEDGPGPEIFKEGVGNNPLIQKVTEARYKASDELRRCQAPKDILLDTGSLGFTAKILPIQLVRLGQIYVVSLPFEPTVVAGLRLRRTVAQRLGVDVKNVIVAGYANDYAGYLTSPEEYDHQDYEGGHTMYGRWQLPATLQEISRLADDLKAGRASTPGPNPPGPGGREAFQPGVVFDAPAIGYNYGDVVTQPQASYARGQQVSVVFDGAHPKNNLHRGGTFLEVQRKVGDGWQTVADDGDWSTKYHWERWGVAASRVTITWDVPADAAAGTYRILYQGDAKEIGGTITPIAGASREFAISP